MLNDCKLLCVFFSKISSVRLYNVEKFVYYCTNASKMYRSA